MANPDDSDFDDFVMGAMNCTFSSAINDNSDSSDLEDILLHNEPAGTDIESEIDDEDIQQVAQIPVHNPGEPNWLNVSNNDPGPSNVIPIYNVNAGPCLPSHFNESSDPIEYFQLFFNDDIVNYICDETNWFANAKKTKLVFHLKHECINGMILPQLK